MFTTNVNTLTTPHTLTIDYFTDSSVVVAVSTLFKFFLDSLTQCGSHYIVVYRLLNGFCGGRSILTPNDRGFLLDQLKKSQVDAEISRIEGVYACDIDLNAQ